MATKISHRRGNTLQYDSSFQHSSSKILAINIPPFLCNTQFHHNMQLRRVQTIWFESLSCSILNTHVMRQVILDVWQDSSTFRIPGNTCPATVSHPREAVAGVATTKVRFFPTILHANAVELMDQSQ